MPPLGFHRERETPKPLSWVQIIPQIKSIACPVLPASLLELSFANEPLGVPTYKAGPTGLAGLGPGRFQVLVPCPYTPVFLGKAFLSSVQLPRWQTPLPNAQLLRSNLQAPPQPTAFILTTPALPALRLLVASLHLSSVFSPFLFTCAHQPGTLPCVLTFVSVQLPLPVQWPSLPHLLLFADPSLKACFQTASYTRLL